MSAARVARRRLASIWSTACRNFSTLQTEKNRGGGLWGEMHACAAGLVSNLHKSLRAIWRASAVALN